ncbi:Para-nitrobenzyl esterase [Corynebacterium pseudopelargi]|uniref:Para-nitrobenzyl esterase n=1 Tax=Corynebacterium pseudopelargi TaxID=2080757 RepID=A0A3G6IUV1_9CORY|nr:Para-nitrobenzyl esterase [Corynebacterium pseudopelargi]
MGASTSNEAHPDLVISTTSGLVGGIRLVDETSGVQVQTWRGIPYGGDTSGSRRFRAPHPVEPWTGVRECSEYGPVAAQPSLGPSDKVRGSEDCLNLDIVRPDSDATLPVVVYFHGGSFIFGSSHEQILRGHALAEAMDVVYVSINFRLGVLGYLDMRSVGQDCEANPAVLDQLLALKWVQRNIAAFGGDPNNVTIMGESAGGAAVLTLMCVPAAAGLFSKAIAQSPPLAAIHSPVQAQFWASELQRRLGFEHPDLEQLRNVDAADLVRAGQKMLWRTGELIQMNTCFGPTVDKRVIFEHPLEVFAQGLQHKVPLLIGTNGDETSFTKAFYLRSTARTRAARRMLESFDPAGTDLVLHMYQNAQRRSDFADLLSDAIFWAPAVHAAGAHAQGAQTWMYRFDFTPPTMRWLGLGAWHSMELTPLFGDLKAAKTSKLHIGGRADLELLSQSMQRLWSRFIHYGNPGREWPRYRSPDDLHPGRATLIFDRELHVSYDPRAAFRRVWERYDMTQWGIGRPEIMQALGLEPVEPLEPLAITATSQHPDSTADTAQHDLGFHDSPAAEQDAQVEKPQGRAFATRQRLAKARHSQAPHQHGEAPSGNNQAPSQHDALEAEAEAKIAELRKAEAAAKKAERKAAKAERKAAKAQRKAEKAKRKAKKAQREAQKQQRKVLAHHGSAIPLRVKAQPQVLPAKKKHRKKKDRKQ